MLFRSATSAFRTRQENLFKTRAPVRLEHSLHVILEEIFFQTLQGLKEVLFADEALFELGALLLCRLSEEEPDQQIVFVPD